jgi:hypothetical protein
LAVKIFGEIEYGIVPAEMPPPRLSGSGRPLFGMQELFLPGMRDGARRPADLLGLPPETYRRPPQKVFRFQVDVPERLGICRIFPDLGVFFRAGKIFTGHPLRFPRGDFLDRKLPEERGQINRKAFSPRRREEREKTRSFGCWFTFHHFVFGFVAAQNKPFFASFAPSR